MILALVIELLIKLYLITLLRLRTYDISNGTLERVKVSRIKVIGLYLTASIPLGGIWVIFGYIDAINETKNYVIKIKVNKLIVRLKNSIISFFTKKI